MAARALWNGTLHAGKLSLPVQLFSAAQDRHVAFHLLHAKDRTRVEQRMVRPDTAEPVPRERIRRGVEAEPGVFVLVEKDELASLEPPASRDLRADRFLPLGTVPAAALDRPYWLGPGKGASHERYFAHAEALEGKGREATVAWVMRKRHYRGVLRAQDGYLLEHILVAPDAPSGTSEILIVGALEALRAEGCGAATFGPAPGAAIGATKNLGKISEAVARAVYDAAVRLFHLDSRTRYRQTFQAARALPSYVLLNPPRMGVREALGLFRAFNVSLA